MDSVVRVNVKNRGEKDKEPVIRCYLCGEPAVLEDGGMPLCLGHAIEHLGIPLQGKELARLPAA